MRDDRRPGVRKANYAEYVNHITPSSHADRGRHLGKDLLISRQISRECDCMPLHLQKDTA
jgi:hypothetical protein